MRVLVLAGCIGAGPAWAASTDFTDTFATDPGLGSAPSSFTRSLGGDTFTYTFDAANGGGSFQYDTAGYGSGASNSVYIQSNVYSLGTTERVSITRAGSATFVFTGIFINNSTSVAPITVAGYRSGSLVGSAQTLAGSAAGATLSFGDIVVDEVRITSQDLKADIDDFQGSAPSPPTTTVATASLSADTGSSSSDFITQTAAQTISGTLSANLATGESVEVSYDNGSSWSNATSFAVGTNAWSTTTTLSGSSTFQARVTNVAGSSAAFSQTYALDTTAPTTTVSTMALSADTGASSSDFITDSAAQTISGTLSANVAAGETVYVSLDNGSTWAAATATVGQNTWSLTGQTLSASNTLKVKVTDTAGNDGTTASQAYVFDTTAPTTTVVTKAFSADTGASSSDFITNTAAQTISGTLSATLAASETVYVSLDNGSTWSAATTTVGMNTWSLAGQTLSVNNTLKVKVTDTAGNDGTTTSQAYVFDTTAPTTTVATMAFSADTGASSSDFITNTVAQTISGTLSANVAAGETVYVSLDNGSTWAAATTTVGMNTWSLAGQTLTASNTLKVKVTDTAGNDGTSALQDYVLQTSAPVVATVATVDATYAAGGDIDLSVTFDRAVTIDAGGGSPRLALTIGASTRHADYLSGSGSTTVVFRHEVLVGDIDSDGIAVGATIDANGGTLRDVAGNDADLTLNGIGSTVGVLVDAVAPTVSSLVRADATPTSASSVAYTLTLAEGVTGVDAADFTIVTTGTAGGSIASVTPVSASVYTVTVGSLSGTGDLRLDVNASATGIADLAGNALSGGATGEVYAVDRVPPQVTSVAVPANGTYLQGQVLNFTVTCDSAVIVSGAPRLPLTIGSTTRHAAYVSGSGSTALVFSYTVQNDEFDMNGIAVGASIDANGGTLQSASGIDATLTLNGLASTAGILVDSVVPTVSSLVRASATPTNAASVDYTLTFSENVTGVDAADVSVVATGTVSGSIASVTPVSASVYTVTVGSLSGTGDLRLDVNASGTGIADLAGNALSGGATGAVYAIDREQPQVTSVAVPDTGSYGRGGVLSFDVSLDEAVIVSGAPFLTLTIGSTTRSAAYVSGSGGTMLTFSYAIQDDEVDVDGIVLGGSIDANGGTLKDAAGNAAVLTLHAVGSTSSVLVDARAHDGGYPDDPWYKDAKSSCGAGGSLGMLAGLLLFVRLRPGRRD